MSTENYVMQNRNVHSREQNLLVLIENCIAGEFWPICFLSQAILGTLWIFEMVV